MCKPNGWHLSIRFNKRGVSLIETILAGVLFLLAMSGIFATLAVVRKPVTNNNKAVEAVQYGRRLMEGLRMSVTASTYNSAGPIALGTYSITQGGYTARYVISPVDSSKPTTSPRKVDMNVTWVDEP